MEKPACGHTRTDSAKKRNRKEVLANYNKTKINIDHQHDRWKELKEALRVQTHAEVPLCGAKIYVKNMVTSYNV
jgi:uncharacterized protein (DUF342 family)